MKKTFYTFLILLFVSQFGFSQCVPIPYTGNHNVITPDSAHFPHAVQNQNFNTTFHLQVAHDTTTGLGVYVFDSIHVDSVTIKPRPIGTVIHYTCNPSSNSILGGNTGCMDLSISSAFSIHLDTFQLIVYTTAKGTLGTVHNFPVPLKIDWYNIIVDTSNIQASVSTVNSDFNHLEVLPNPASSKIQLNFQSLKSANFNCGLMDVLGRKILVENGTAHLGNNQLELDVNSIPNGIYFLNFYSDEKLIGHQKIIVQH